MKQSASSAGRGGFSKSLGQEKQARAIAKASKPKKGLGELRPIRRKAVGSSSKAPKSMQPKRNARGG